MQLIDWAIVVIYFIASLAIGLYYYRKAAHQAFFLRAGSFHGGWRDFQWWQLLLLPILAVTELVGQTELQAIFCGICSSAVC
jgi:Na+/proline symporter